MEILTQCNVHLGINTCQIINCFTSLIYFTTNIQDLMEIASFIKESSSVTFAILALTTQFGHKLLIDNNKNINEGHTKILLY